MCCPLPVGAVAFSHNALDFLERVLRTELAYGGTRECECLRRDRADGAKLPVTLQRGVDSVTAGPER
jgi:hypothetical protein